MEIKDLIKRPIVEQDKKLKKSYSIFENLVDELKKKKIPEEIVNPINQDIEEINSFSGSNKDLRKRISKSQSNILKLIEKELKLVPKNLYRQRWLAIGMSAFGIPLGVAFGASLGNMAFLGIGIPIGMVIGMAVGAGMDKKAFEEGRQLELEIPY
jgi:hypothetical protein